MSTQASARRPRFQRESKTRALTPAVPPIIPPQPPAVLAREISRLAPSQQLARVGPLVVYDTSWAQTPRLMHEVGRLREITFRAIGEGTNQPMDLDAHDRHYRQLIVWDAEHARLVGGYRLGDTRQLIGAGRPGLYTETLFRYRPELLRALHGSLELGRSFVRQEYQRRSPALHLLWRGIAACAASHTRCRYLFGAVSISDRYSQRTRGVIARYLRQHHAHPLWRGWASGRCPFSITPRLPGREAPVSTLAELKSRVRTIEAGRADLPVLVGEYIKLGGKLLALHVDRDFNDSLDALMVVDLATAPQRRLRRYFGDEAARIQCRFLPDVSRD